MSKILFAFAMATVLASGHTKLLPHQQPVSHVNFTDVALHMIERFIAPKTNTLMVMEHCRHRSGARRNYQSNVVEHFVRNFNANMAIQLFFEYSEHKPWDYNLFIVDSHLAFIELCLHFPETLHERQFYFLILYTNRIYSDAIRETAMIAIFRTCRFLNVINVVVMMPRHDGSIGFYTYCIYTPHVCDRLPTVLEINAYRHGRLQHELLFPERLTNFYNCPLKVCAHLLYPMLSLKHGYLPDSTADRELSGIDGDLLNILAKALRFRIDVSIPDQPNQIGIARNSTGCFRELELAQADVAIGALSNTQPNFEVFTTSTPYYQSMYYFVVRSGLHYGALEQLANPFKAEVWSAIGRILLVAMVFIKCVLTFGRRAVRDFILGRCNYSPITNLMTALLGNPVSRVPRRNFARFLLMSWLLITLVLRNAYQGKMFDSLRTSKRVPIPRGINELIDRRFVLFAARYVDFYPQNLTYIIPNLGVRYQLIETSSQPYATLSLRDTIAAYNKYKNNTSHLTYVNEAIYTFQMVMYFRKHSIFKGAFDRKLKQLTGAGITRYVADRHANRRFLNLNTSNEKVARISNTALQGVYIIYGAMCGVAVLVMLLELYSTKSPRVRQMLDWLHYSAYGRDTVAAQSVEECVQKARNEEGAAVVA